MHKIRLAMGQRDDRYNLNGFIEFDEGHFEHATSQSIDLKRGRGSQRQTNVAVMAESTPLENIETGEKSSHYRCFKMKVAQSFEKEELNSKVVQYIHQDSIIFSDKSTSYVDFSELVDIHITTKSDKETTKTTLKCVHIAISSSKRNLLGVIIIMISLSIFTNYLRNDSISKLWFISGIINKGDTIAIAFNQENKVTYISENIKKIIGIDFEAIINKYVSIIGIRGFKP